MTDSNELCHLEVAGKRCTMAATVRPCTGTASTVGYAVERHALGSSEVTGVKMTGDHTGSAAERRAVDNIA